MVNIIPSVPGLRTLLALLFCLHVASACIQCDRRVRKMVDDYINDKNEGERDRYKDARNTAYTEYLARANEISGGVIDPTTLYKVTTEFQNEFRQFASKKTTTWHDFIRMMSNRGGERILKKHLEAFVGERGGACPNGCGLLHRKVKRCTDGGVCPTELKDCSKQLDCGERVVRATEDDQVVLDCFLPWHGLVAAAAVGASGRKEYRYSWAEGTHAPAESDFKPLLVTEESGMVLNQVLVEQWGTYRCELLLSGTTTPVSRFTFRLHVAPAPPPPTLRPPLALPTLPPGPAPSKPLMHTVCVAVTTVCLAGSVAVTVFLGTMVRRHARRLTGED